jgi:hypothetical protein
MRSFMLAVCLILLNVVPLAACDVSLFSLVAGNSPNKAFASSLTGLVTFAKAVGNNSQNKETMPGHMQKFMVKWIEFSNTYLQNPPEWAKKDPDWKSKFDGLTSLIGSIRKNLSSLEPDQQKAHHEIQAFTRRLTRLYDMLPMDALARLRLDISMHIDHVWTAWLEQNRQKLGETTENFSAVSRIFLKELDEATASAAVSIVHRAEELHKMAAQENVFTGKSFEFMLNMAENEFAQFNEAQNQSAAATEK